MQSIPAPNPGTGPCVNTADQDAGSQRRRTPFWTATAAVLWLVMIVAATARMITLSNVPGTAGTPPAGWPAQSGIPLQLGRPTLVMFAHPHCPCTRASLGELERLLSNCPDRVAAHVVFIKPEGTEQDWSKTDLWRMASTIHGVSVCQDDARAEALCFRTETSGITLLYDANGSLLFHGGITLSRGHAGDNPGRSAIEALLKGQEKARITTSAFGCPLFEAGCKADGEVCRRQP
jgi:hypothetical protein